MSSALGRFRHHQRTANSRMSARMPPMIAPTMVGTCEEEVAGGADAMPSAWASIPAALVDGFVADEELEGVEELEPGEPKILELKVELAEETDIGGRLDGSSEVAGIRLFFVVVMVAVAVLAACTGDVDNDEGVLDVAC